MERETRGISGVFQFCSIVIAEDGGAFPFKEQLECKSLKTVEKSM
jgi:hypothetical protein